MNSDSDYYDEVDKKFAETKGEYIIYYQSLGHFESKDGKKVVCYQNVITNRIISVYLENGFLKPIFGSWGKSNV